MVGGVAGGPGSKKRGLPHIPPKRHTAGLPGVTPLPLHGLPCALTTVSPLPQHKTPWLRAGGGSTLALASC